MMKAHDSIPRAGRRGYRAFVSVLAGIILCALAIPALALVTSVKPVPASGSVAFGPAATFTVTWGILRGGAPNSPVVVTGAPGVFKPTSGSLTILGTTPAMTRSFPGNPGSVFITETFVVPQTVMRWALEHNNGQFVYQRAFADDPPGLTFVPGTVFLNTTGGMGGPIGVANVNLTFNDGTSFKAVEQGAGLSAIAHVKSTGSGQLEAVWEVSEANADGSAFYRPIRTVSQSLSGQHYIEIESPPLPTTLEGRENVRFRVTAPTNGIDSPVISYFVTPKPKAISVELLGPEAGARAADGTVFRWKGVKRAVAYRLQVLTPSGKVVASMLVTGDETPLSPFVRGQMRAASEYQWRVVAIGRDGAALGESKPRALNVR